MTFKIVSDSSSDLTSLSGVPFASVPLKITTSDKEYTDDAALNVSEMQDDLSTYKGRSHTACPGIGEYLAAFGDAEYVFCITITSGLSGSYNSATAAAREYESEHPGRRVRVIDSLSTGPENALVIAKLAELIESGESFDSICEKIADYQKTTGLIFVLESLRNLANNGRVSPIVAKLSGILGIRIVGRASDVGTLEITNKSRGIGGALSDVIKNLGDYGYRGGKLRIHHAENLEAAEKFRDKILSVWPNAEIEVGKTRGLCSFYAERGGLLIGFEKNLG